MVYFAVPIRRENVLYRITFVIIYYLCRGADRHKEWLNERSLSKERMSRSLQVPECAYPQPLQTGR